MDAEGVTAFFDSVLVGDKLSHAYLFLGGIEACSLAEKLAGMLLCQAPENAHSCDRCADCRQLAGGFHPDLAVVVPMPNTIKIEQIRELQKTANLEPYQAGRKVFVIKEAQKMTDDAANCLLKSLEEPAPNVFFILVADSGEEMLPTVVSRCQKFLVGGSVDSDVDPVRLTGFLTAWREGDVISLLKVGEILAEDRKLAGEFLDHLAFFYRDQAVYSETGGVWAHDWAKAGLSFSDLSAWQTSDLVRCFALVEEARRHLNANANTRLVMDSLFLHLAGEA